MLAGKSCTVIASTGHNYIAQKANPRRDLKLDIVLVFFLFVLALAFIVNVLGCLGQEISTDH